MMFFYMYCDKSQAPINPIANIAFEEISVTVERDVSGQMGNIHHWNNKLFLAIGAG